MEHDPSIARDVHAIRSSTGSGDWASGSVRTVRTNCPKWRRWNGSGRESDESLGHGRTEHLALPLSFVFLLWVVPLFAGPARAQNSAARPFVDSHGPEDERMAREIVEHATFKAERSIAFHGNVAVFRFLVDRPDFAAAINRGLGFDDFLIRQEGPHYQIRHGYARGTFWVAERQGDQMMFLANGTYEHPLLRAAGIRLRARSLVIETFDLTSAQPPVNEVRVRVHAFLQIENSVLGPVLRGFGPLVRGAFESKLTAADQIAPSLSEAVFQNRDKLLERVRRIDGLDPIQLSRFEELVKSESDQPVSNAPCPEDAQTYDIRCSPGAVQAP